MANRKRNIQMKFYVTKEENGSLTEKWRSSPHGGTGVSAEDGDNLVLPLPFDRARKKIPITLRGDCPGNRLRTGMKCAGRSHQITNDFCGGQTIAHPNPRHSVDFREGFEHNNMAAAF